MKKWYIPTAALVVCGLIAFGGATLANGNEATPTPPASAQSTPAHVVRVQGTYDFSYYSLESQCEKAASVVIGVVTKEYPIRINEGSGWLDDGTEVLPIPYKGYQIQVSRWFGDGTPSHTIDVYHMGGGQTVIEDAATRVDVELTPSLTVGQEVFLPISPDVPYGVRLEQGSYWMLSNGRGAFVLSKDGSAVRAVKLESVASPSAGIADASSLTNLTAAALASGLVEREF
jgi:hypothetical protein